MPKTRDAFAFRGFDTTRIFESLKFALTDQPIFFDLFPGCTHDEVYLSCLESRENPNWCRYGEIVFGLKACWNRISRHISRLTRYSSRLICNDDSDLSKIQNKIRRFKRLFYRYHKIAAALKKLFENVEVGANTVNSRIRHEFARRLKGARQHMGFTQAQIATKIGMSQGGYTLYELARRDPSIPTLARLAEILQCPVGWLMGLTPEK